MNIVASEHEHYVTIEPAGELDANSSFHLDETIRSFIDQDFFSITGVDNFDVIWTDNVFISTCSKPNSVPGVPLQFMIPARW